MLTLHNTTLPGPACNRKTGIGSIRIEIESPPSLSPVNMPICRQARTHAASKLANQKIDFFDF